MKQWMPVLLVVAVASGVGIAAFTTNAPRPAATAAVPAPPLMPTAGEDNGEAPEDPEAPRDPAAAPPASDQAIGGVVREHFDVAQYTYMRLSVDGGDAWAAVYRAPVKDGKMVTVLNASALRHFHSRELNRDFDTIYFGVLPGYESAPSMGASANANAAAAPSAGPVHEKPVAGGTTIVELAKNAAALDGKQVTVVGRVAKETDGILDRNWIHIVDGTGDPKDGTGDLLVTTDATSAIGADVVAKGTVRINQDFGSGYAYKFLIEKATLAPAAK